MQAVHTLSNHRVQQTRIEWASVAASLGAFLTRLFGCWHSEMSRPYTHGGESYRACLSCGARREFDAERWEMIGPYYYRRPASGELHAVDHTTYRVVRHTRRLRAVA